VGSGYGRTGDGRFSLTVLNAAIQKLSFAGYVAPRKA
jgi:hypothetical protein